MSTIVPIRLSLPTNNVLQVVSLFPPNPLFQPGLSPNEFVRNTNVISFGFPFSLDIPYDGIDLTTASASATGSDLPGVYPVPPNAYALLLPSQIYNNDTTLDVNFGILLIDVEVCPIQPGISRLRIDYIGNVLSSNGSMFNTSVTDYLDMPFWQTWDNHPSSLNEIVNYEEQTTDFLQSEINLLSKDLYNNLNRGQLKGLSLSGQLYATQALQLNTSAIPNNSPASSQQKYLADKFTEFQSNKNLPKTILPKSDNFVYNITSVSPANGAFPGEQITVFTDVAMVANDQIYLATYPLPSSVNGNAISAVIPSTLTFALDINLSIVGQNITKSAPYPLSIFNNPEILSINGVGSGFVAPGASFVLYGKNLGVSQGATSITFNNSASGAIITSWTPKAITGIVPTTALSGPVVLITDKGASTSIVLNVLSDKQLDIFQISPDVSIDQSAQTIQFTSTLNSTIVNSNWSLVDDFGNISNGDVAHGFIASNGIYTAPSIVPTTFNLKVVANHTRYYGTVYDEVSVLVVSSANTYTISPSSTILEPSYTQPFKLYDTNNNAVSNVIWYVNGFGGGNSLTGVINYEGLYQAPNIIPTTSTVNITGIGPNGLATAIVAIAAVGSTTANNLTSNNQSHSLDEKAVSAPACCLLPVVNTYQAIVGTPLLISDFATSNGLSISNGVTSYVTAFLQSNCGNQDGNLYVGTGGNLTNYGLISYVPQSTGFASIQVFSTTTMVVNNEAVTSGGYSTILVNIAAAPIPILTKIDAGCPGQNVVLTGQNFPPDSKLVFTSNNQILPTVVPPNTVDGVNYSMTITIPSNISILNNTYNVQLISSFTSNSNIIILTVPTSCSLPSTTAQFVLSPSAVILSYSTSAQYNAYLQYTDGSEQNVNSNVTWYVENIEGGNSTYGTISNNGLYTAPSSSSNVNSPTITGVYVYQNTIVQATAYASVVPLSSTVQGQGGLPTNPPASAEGSCCLLTVSPNNATIIVPGNPTQFYANFSINGGQSTVVIASQWYVNGIANGNSTYGTITNSGLYTPPAFYVPSDLQSITVGASLNYTPTNGTLNTYNGYAIITFQQIITQSGNSEIVFTKQLNLSLGDGRFGYIPAGTTVYCTAGFYLYVTYQEILDPNFLPINYNVPQILTYGTISAQSPNLLSVLYNEGTIIQDTSGDGGSYNKPLTVPLGIVDPTSGFFQSMWDMISVFQPQANSISPQPLVCSLSHDYHDDTLDSFNIIAHIDNRFKNTPPKLVLKNLDKILWLGKATYKKNKLQFEKSLQAINFDKVANSLNKESINAVKSYTIKPNELLIAKKIKDEWELQVLSLGDTLPLDSRIYVLGIVLDQFYSLWPLLRVTNTFKNDFTQDAKYIKLGDLLIQWGTLNISQIKFPIPFKNSYSLKTDATPIEQSLEGFTFTKINKDNNFWFALGS